MADSNRSVAIVAVLAILIMVGLAIYFVSQERDSDIEIDLGVVETFAEADRTAQQWAAPPAGVRFAL